MKPEHLAAAGVELTDFLSLDQTPAEYPPAAAEVLSRDDLENALREISTWPGYAPTPLHSLGLLASAIDCGQVSYKDESHRFGLGSFKALGGAYAVLRLVAERYRQEHGSTVELSAVRSGECRDFAAGMMVTTATDGNHGRSVAWGAENAGCQCRIYIHAQVSDGRKRAMEAFGATVVRINGDYDESVRVCAAESAQHGWNVVSDTSYDGYMSVPRDVMAGYSVLASETLHQIDRPLTHVFLQAGVGGLAAAVGARFWLDTGPTRARVIVVESQHAACLMESFRHSGPKNIEVSTETVMAGLSCGEVSLLAWQVLENCVDAVVTLPDQQVPVAMKMFADGNASGEPIEAGECAVPGALALMAICADPQQKQQLGIDNNSHILLLGCEGATDPEVYASLLAAAEAG